MLEEKAFIAGLSCPELEEYAHNQVVESKKYFGNKMICACHRLEKSGCDAKALNIFQ